MKKNIKKAILCLSVGAAVFSAAGNFGAVEAASSSDKANAARAKQLYSQCVEKFSSNDTRGAAACFIQADDYAKTEPLYKILAGDSLKSLKQYSSAIRYYQDAIDNAGKNKKMKKQIVQKAYIGLAECYAESGDKDEALKYADKSINDYGKDYRGHYVKGLVLQKTDKDGAIAEYQKSLEVDPKQYNSYVKLVSLYEEKGDTADVISTYQKAIDYRPLDEEMKMALAQFYISQTKKEGATVNYYPQAVEVLHSLVNVNPQNAQAHYFLSTLYLLQGDKDGCYQELTRTNELNAGLGNRLAREIEAFMKKKIADAQQAKQSSDGTQQN